MNIKSNPLVFLFSHLWRFSEGRRKNIVIYAIMFFLANVFDLINPLIFAKVLTMLQNETITKENLPTMLAYLLVFVGLTIGFWMFHGPARVMEMKNAFYAQAKYRQYLVDGTLDLPATWHTDHHSGDTIDKINRGANALDDFGCNSWEAISALIKFFVSAAILIYFDTPSIVIVIVFAVMAMFTIYKFDKHLVPLYTTTNNMNNHVTEKIFDFISNITTVIVLKIERLVSKDVKYNILKPYPPYYKSVKLNEWKWFTVSILTALMSFTVLTVYITTAVYKGNLVQLSMVFILYSYVERINGTFFNFSYLYNFIVRKRTNIKNSEDLSVVFTDKKRSLNYSFPENWKDLSIANLNFNYVSKNSTLIIDNLKFDIHHGERIAFIGESGSGKTTIMKLFVNLYDPTSISVKIDGKDVKNGFKTIAPAVALIPQEPELFTTTIKTNLTVGLDIPQAKIDHFVRLAMFEDVIAKLPNKYQSKINEKGVNLSGGEKQRLALARGLLLSENKEIILLDEPTSSVDFANEKAIYQNIFTEFKDKTIISTIHRLHLLPQFDKIYVFDSGKIVANGTFDELLAKSKKFQDIWNNYQSSNID